MLHAGMLPAALGKVTDSWISKGILTLLWSVVVKSWNHEVLPSTLYPVWGTERCSMGTQQGWAGYLMNYAGNWEKLNQIYAAKRAAPQHKMLCLSAQSLLSEKCLAQMNDWRAKAPQMSKLHKDVSDCRSVIGEKNAPQTVYDTVLHRKKVGATLPKLLSVLLQNFLVFLKMWSRLNSDFHSVFSLVPDAFCDVWT